MISRLTSFLAHITPVKYTYPPAMKIINRGDLTQCSGPSKKNLKEEP